MQTHLIPEYFVSRETPGSSHQNALREVQTLDEQLRYNYRMHNSLKCFSALSRDKYVSFFKLVRNLKTSESLSQVFDTPEYIAPEVILMQCYGKPLDW